MKMVKIKGAVYDSGYYDINERDFYDLWLNIDNVNYVVSASKYYIYYFNNYDLATCLSPEQLEVEYENQKTLKEMTK